MTKCMHCGHVTRTTSPRKATMALPERADLDRQLTAHELTQPQYFDACKLIARRDDLRFLLRVTALTMTSELRVEAHALVAQLEQRKATAADITAINSLRDRYRMTLPSLKVIAGSPESLRREAEREKIAA